MAIQTFGPKLKLARAKRHIRDLESLLEAFLGDNPHRFVVEEDANEPGLIIRAIFDRPLPNETATVIGDAIHNLRAALDHLAAEAVRANRQTPTRNTGFPIDQSQSGFNGNITSKLAGAPDSFVNMVKGLHPYRDPDANGRSNFALYHLAQLDNLDKHMTLLPTVSVIEMRNVRVTYPNGTIASTISVLRVPGNSHVNVAQFGGTGLKFEADSKGTFEVLFQGTDLIDGERVRAVLLTMAKVVTDIIDDAEKLTV